MRKKDGNIDFTDPAFLTWELFEKSGRIAYYLLYKKLSKK